MHLWEYYVHVRTDENAPSPTDRFMLVRAPSAAKARAISAKVDRVVRVVEVCPAVELAENFVNVWREIAWVE